MKSKFTKVVFILLILSTFFFANKTYASTFMISLKEGISSMIIAINSSIVRITKDGFCERYLQNKADGSYITNIREKSAQDLCKNYVKKDEIAQIPISSDKTKDSTEAKPDEIKATSSKSLTDYLKIFSPIKGNPVTVEVKQTEKEVKVEKVIEPVKEEIKPAPISLNLSKYGILSKVNNERISLGILSLTENSLLNQIALDRLDDMFAKGYFEHTSPSGRTVGDFAKNVSYEYLVIGENLALGDYLSDSVLVSAWMASPGHKANIVNQNYSETGIAVSKGNYQGKEATIAVQVFAKPAKACPYPDEATKNKVMIFNQSIQNLKASAEKTKLVLETMKTNNTSSVDYNAKVAEYNLLAKSANNLSLEIQNLTDIYNKQVGVYNDCVKTR